MSCKHDQMGMCPACMPQTGFQTKEPLTLRKDGAESLGERGVCKSCGALCFGFVCQRCELNVVRSDRDRYKAALEKVRALLFIDGGAAVEIALGAVNAALTPAKDGGE